MPLLDLLGERKSPADDSDPGEEVLASWPWPKQVDLEFPICFFATPVDGHLWTLLCILLSQFPLTLSLPTRCLVRRNGSEPDAPAALGAGHQGIVSPPPSRCLFTPLGRSFDRRRRADLSSFPSWDKLYSNELANHAHDPTDTGTNWFEDSGAQDKVVEFLEELFAASPAPVLSWAEDPPRDSRHGEGEDAEAEDGEARLARARARAAFLDLGTGNGDMLFGLRDAGWAGPMLGVDYSERSVEFARRIGATRRPPPPPRHRAGDDDDDEAAAAAAAKEEEAPPAVEFAVHDLLADDDGGAPAAPLAARPAGWDVVLDKGTFDAISLSAGVDARTGRRVAESYRDRVLPLVRPGGLFLVTSCNWTEDELARWFVPPRDAAAAAAADARFEQVGRVDYPSFSFGGVKGSTISTLCFRKITNGSA